MFVIWMNEFLLPLRLQAHAARIFHLNCYAIAAAVFHVNRQAILEAVVARVFQLIQAAIERVFAAGVFHFDRSHFATMLFDHPQPFFRRALVLGRFLGGPKSS